MAAIGFHGDAPGGPFDILVDAGDATDILRAGLCPALTTPALAGLAISCHAFWSGPYSRTQATETEPATQVLAVSRQRPEQPHHAVPPFGAHETRTRHLLIGLR